MKVRIWHTEGSVEIQHMPDENALELLEQFEDEEDGSALRFTLDNRSIVVIDRRHVIRIDIDPETQR